MAAEDHNPSTPNSSPQNTVSVAVDEPSSSKKATSNNNAPTSQDATEKNLDYVGLREHDGDHHVVPIQKNDYHTFLQHQDINFHANTHQVSQPHDQHNHNDAIHHLDEKDDVHSNSSGLVLDEKAAANNTQNANNLITSSDLEVKSHTGICYSLSGYELQQQFLTGTHVAYSSQVETSSSTATQTSGKTSNDSHGSLEHGLIDSKESSITAQSNLSAQSGFQLNTSSTTSTIDADNNSTAATTVNQAPTITSNHTPSFTEGDAPVKIDSNIQIADPGQANLQQVKLSISNFVIGDELSLATPVTSIQMHYDTNTGELLLTPAGGATTATLTAFNLAMQAITYKNDSQNPDITSRTLVWEVNDGFATSSKTTTLLINSVNDAPIISKPNATSIDEDTTLSITDLSFSDVDHSDELIQVILTVNDGNLSLANSTIVDIIAGSDVSNTMTLLGSVNNINSALNGLVFSPDNHYNGTATVSVTVNDLGNTGHGGSLTDSDSFTITVNAVNDVPLITVPSTQNTNEDNNLSITTLSIADVDSSTGIIETTLSVNDGILTLATTTGISFTAGSDGASSMTIQGTLAAINTALTGMVFDPDNDFNGTSTVNISVDDLGNSGSGGPLTDANSFDITVNAVNDGPLITVPTTLSKSEDATPLSITDLSITDVDSATSTIEIGLNVNDGILTLASTTGLVFTSGSNAASSMTLTGTLTDINTALLGMTYDSDNHFNGIATVNISVNDLGNTGSGGALTDVDSFDINVNTVNDAPVITVPSPQNTNEDTNLSITTLSLADVDSGASTIEATLSVNDGILTLATTTGIAFTAGSDGASSMTIQGTLAAINTALTGMIFNPDNDFNGTSTVNVSVDDLGNSGSGGSLTDADSFNITVNAVNDDPIITVPSPQNTNEDTNLSITALSLADVDSGASTIEATLSVNDGILTLATTTGIAFTAGSDGASSMTIQGTLAAINTALTGMVFNPNNDFNGTSTVNVSVDDLGNSGSGGSLTDADSFDITVNAVNDDPIITVPSPQNTNEDTNLSITALSLADVDSGASTIEATLSVNDGILTLASTTGITFTAGSDGASSMTIQGTLAAINTALTGMVFNPDNDFNGTSTVNVSVDDLGNSGSGGSLTDADSFNITVSAVNDDPIITVPSPQNTNEDTNLSITTLSLADVDSGASTIEATLSVNDGILTLASTTGIAFTAGSDGASSMTIQGTLAAINTALTGMVFNPNNDFNGTSTVNVSVDDLGNSGSGGSLTDADSFDITVNAVNDDPIITVPSPQNTNEDTNLSITALSLADVDSGASTIEATLSVNDGILTLATTTGIAFTAGSDGASSMTIQGTLAAINTALTGMVFNPDNDFNGTSTVNVSVDDLGNSGSGGSLTDADSFNITVNAVNDDPIITVPSPQNTNEDTNLSITALSLADVDSGASTIEATLSVNDGILTLATTTGIAFTAGSDGASSMTIQGTLAAINTALTGMVFNPDNDFNGTSTVNISVDDLGNSGSGGSLTDADSFDITVNAVNDDPIINSLSLGTNKVLENSLGSSDFALSSTLPTQRDGTTALFNTGNNDIAAMTVEFWVKFDDLATDWQRVVSFVDGANSFFQVAVDSNDGELIFHVRDNSIDYTVQACRAAPDALRPS